MKTLIKGGTVVNAAESFRADVLIDGETVAAVGIGLPFEADREIDATGRWVIPGGIDVHTHLDMPMSEGVVSADDFESGTVAAAFGGTTSIIDFVVPGKGESLRAAWERWMQKAEGKAVVDYGFHMCVNTWNDAIRGEMDDIAELGMPSFKLFTAYPGRLMLDDGAIFEAMQHAEEIGARIMVHAENGHVIEALIRQALSRGETSPKWHARTRPPQTEAEAIHRLASLAELTDGSVYVVHLSSAEGLDAVIQAQDRGLSVHAETCPQYLVLTDERYDQPCLEAAKHVMSPPLREGTRQDELWRALDRGTIETVATDHCPFTLAQKACGLKDFTKIPNGGHGIEERMSLLFDQGVRTGRISPHRWVDVTSTAPAKRFGLYPRKGTVSPGADADLVVWDPDAERTFSAKTHHSRVDYSLYEGVSVRGAAEVVLSRGRVVVQGGRLEAAAGSGRFVRRGRRG